MTNEEIIDIYLKNGLIKRCVECQFAKLDRGKWQFRDDFQQDLYIILEEYPNNKLLDAHINNKMNALITRIILNNVASVSSHFYRRYIKFDRLSDNIDELIKNEDAGDFSNEDETWGDGNNYMTEANHSVKL